MNADYRVLMVIKLTVDYDLLILFSVIGLPGAPGERVN